MSSLVAIPEPASVDLERAHNLAQQITEWAGQTESIPDLEDARARVAAIETYIRKRDAQAAAALAAADRRLEVRIGELLGPSEHPGTNQHSSSSLADEKHPLTPNQRHQFRRMADHQEVPEVAQAIENGASRSEVLRQIDKAKAKHPDTSKPNSRAAVAERVEKAKRMAAEGYTSRQIGQAIGIQEMTGFKKTHGIDVPADAVVGNRGRLNPDRVINEAAHTLEGLAMGLELITPDQIDPETLPDLCASMQTSLRQILKFHQRMKELRDG